MVTNFNAAGKPEIAATLCGGLIGGALGGLFDGALTLVRDGNASAMRAGWLVGLCAGLFALCGLVLAGVAFMLERALRRRMATWAGAASAMLLAAPVVVFDSFALFAGRAASQVSGHLVISVVLAVVALCAVGLAWRTGARLGRPAVVALLFPLAVAAYAANAFVLPRLYPWFHASLTAVFLAALVACGHVLLARRRPGRVGAVVCVGVAVALTLGAWPRVMASQRLRFVARDKTVVLAPLLRAIPQVGVPRSTATPAGTEAAAGPPLPEGPHRPEADVILISIDALRVDHVGAYGYPRPTTPNIDALARKSVRFERAYAQAPHTSFSAASMLTGKHYPTISRVAPADARDLIAVVLRQYGWKTAAFYPPAVFYVDAGKLRAYEENNFGFEYVKVEFLDAHKRLRQIEEFFAAERPKKTFLWLHLFEPHEPYDARDGHDFGKGDVDRYDSEIAYADAAVGRVLDFVEQHRPGAIIILTADHGEEFDEHGGRYHGRTLYDEQIRVPLLVHVPGVPPHVVSGPVGVIDIAPTILGLLDVPIPARMRATNLGPWLAAPAAPADRLPPVFAEVDQKRMMVSATDKLICDIEGNYCAYFDLKTDPHEKNNLADDRPAAVAALRARLDRWLDDSLRFEPAQGDAVPTAIEQGRLGKAQAVPGLIELLRPGQTQSVRREAARLLVALPMRPDSGAALATAMADRDPEVRDWATVAAARVGLRDGVEGAKALVARAGSQAGDEVRVAAALMLATIGDASGVTVLADALDRCQGTAACREIVNHLGAMRDRRAVPALLNHLPDVQNRHEIVAALADIGDPSAGPALMDRLAHDEYVPVRAAAAAGLGRIGGAGAAAALAAALRSESEDVVLWRVRAAVIALARRKAATTAPASAAPARPGTRNSPPRTAAP